MIINTNEIFDSVMILNRILANIQDYPNNSAIVINGQSHTYGELGSHMLRIAYQLRGLKDQRIGVITHSDFATYANILGILFSGNTFVPIVPFHSIDRNLEIISAGTLRCIYYSSDDFPEELRAAGVPFVDTNTLSEEEVLQSGVEEGQCAYILFTSGSTGVPKGVPISVSNLEAFANGFFDLQFKLNQNDRFLQMFDFSFDLSVFSYLIPLIIGGTVYPLIASQTKYLSVYKTLKDARITVALMVPSIINFLKPYLPKVVFPELRYAAFCGEALLESDLNIWKRSCPNAEQWNFYGPTEATIFCTKFNCTGDVVSRNGIVSIGSAFNGTKLALFNQEREIDSKMIEGELCLSGVQVTNGYLNTSLNEKSFFIGADGVRYYRTGDLALIDEEENFHYCGRLDNQVKIQGFRVELGEIENIAAKVIGKNAVAVFERDCNDNAVIALFLEGSQEDERILKAKLALHISEYALPRVIFFVKEFPLNLNGKIDRKLLKASFKEYLK